MQLGMIGLGRMGANMVRRLARAGHDCVVYDVSAPAVQALAREGATGAASLPAFVQALARPRTVWIMVPAAVVDQTLASLAPLLERDDVIIDGGNSHYHDDIRRAGELGARGLHYVDVGTSGGVWGLERGFCLMIGGEAAVVKRLDPIFASLAPGLGSIPRTPGREKIGGTAEHGYLHCGPNGAGHFVKMVHNGIEYGLMAAYAEGLNILRHANAGAATARAADAETTPLRTPEHYRYDLDLRDIAEVWRRGSVVASWLLDLTASALTKSRDLGAFVGSRLRFGGGALDDRGRHRRGRAGAGAERRALRAVQLARQRRVRGQGALRAALRIRRAPGEGRRGRAPERVSAAAHAPVVFLADVDNTLLDNDRVIADLRRHLDLAVGPEGRVRYWALFEQLRAELGYADYLGALQRYRLEYPHDLRLLTVSGFLVDYPFANRLYPGSLDVLARFRSWGPTVILSDGDVVFQPRKVERSGLGEAVDGVLIYVHKERELDDVECRYPADHYVLVDDKLRVLAAVKRAWGARVTTVFPRQGHYAHDAEALAGYPPADLTVERIGDLLDHDLSTLRARAGAGPAARPAGGR